MSNKKRTVKRYVEADNVDTSINANVNVMPDGMLEAISPTDLAILAIAKDAPKIPSEENEKENR